jgi:hypothetical protein
MMARSPMRLPDYVVPIIVAVVFFILALTLILLLL